MKELSPERVDALTARLRALTSAPCPRCGRGEWKLFPGYLVERGQTQLRDLVIGSGQPSLTMVAEVCRHCGFVSSHSLDALGATPQAYSSCSR